MSLVIFGTVIFLALIQRAIEKICEDDTINLSDDEFIALNCLERD